jgi:hypothetical protein
MNGGRSRMSETKEAKVLYTPTEVQRMLGGFSDGEIEIRQQRDKTYKVFYPEVGFIADPVCPTGCKVHHKHTRKLKERGWEACFGSWESLTEAQKWAEFIAEGRDVKMVPFSGRGRVAVTEEICYTDTNDEGGDDEG